MMTTEPVLNDLLCVAVNNNPSKGNFIGAVGAQPASAFATASLYPRYSFVQTLDPATDRGIDVAAAATGSAFSVDDTIPAASFDTTHHCDAVTATVGCYASAGGVFALPAAGPSGLCVDEAPVRFMRSTRGTEGFGLPAPVTCTRRVAPAEVGGCAALDPARLRALLIGRLPSANVDSTTTSFVTIDTKKVWRKDLVTGAMTDVTASVLSPLLRESVLPRCGCANALVEAELVVTHDGSGAIQSVIAELVVGNVNGSASHDSYSGAFTCDTIGVETKWGVHFVTNATGAAERRHKSGNPGYRIGAPLLVGNASANTTAGADSVEAKRSGLVLWGSSNDGECDGSDASLGVGFMADMASSCSKTLNLAELKALCNSVGDLSGVANVADVNINVSNTMYACGGVRARWHAPGPRALLVAHRAPSLPPSPPSPPSPSSFPSLSSRRYVGKYGNADPLQRATDWIEVTRSLPTSSAAWVEKSRSCTNLVTSMHYEVLVAKAGEGGNPQRKVVAMNTRFGTEDLWFRMAGKTEQQQIIFTSTITFVEWEGAVGAAITAPLVLGVRPLLPSMPADLFYPFTSTSREIDLTQNTDWGVVVLLILIAAVVVVVVVYVFSRLRMAQIFIWFCALSLACIAVVLFTASISVVNAAAEAAAAAA